VNLSLASKEHSTVVRTQISLGKLLQSISR
jgi:hypothetical protein